MEALVAEAQARKVGPSTQALKIVCRQSPVVLKIVPLYPERQRRCLRFTHTRIHKIDVLHGTLFRGLRQERCTLDAVAVERPVFPGDCPWTSSAKCEMHEDHGKALIDAFRFCVQTHGQGAVRSVAGQGSDRVLRITHLSRHGETR